MRIKPTEKFEPCPEYTGKAVCVDITPLRKMQSQYGDRDVFRLVFEVDIPREDGTRFCVWSAPFTPSLNEKSNFRRFLRTWLGRDLTEAELADFDTDVLIGRAAQMVVIQEQKNGEVYANIAACTPDKSGQPLRPCGKYIRVKDRNVEPAEVDTMQAEPDVDHGSVRIHVGKHTGKELRSLTAENLFALCKHWMPTASANLNPSPEDKRLIAALEWWLGVQNGGPF